MTYLSVLHSVHSKPNDKLATRGCQFSGRTNTEQAVVPSFDDGPLASHGIWFYETRMSSTPPVNVSPVYPAERSSLLVP
jgi:hypothetical protein